MTWKSAPNIPISYYLHDAQTHGKDKVGNRSQIVKTPLYHHPQDEKKCRNRHSRIITYCFTIQKISPLAIFNCPLSHSILAPGLPRNFNTRHLICKRKWGSGSIPSRMLETWVLGNTWVWNHRSLGSQDYSNIGQYSGNIEPWQPNLLRNWDPESIRPWDHKSLETQDHGNVGHWKHRTLRTQDSGTQKV